MRRIVPLPTDIDPWRDLLDRTDVRLVDGILHLVSDTTTPADALAADLCEVATALESAGIEVLLVRESNGRPKLVVGSTAPDVENREPAPFPG